MFALIGSATFADIFLVGRAIDASTEKTTSFFITIFLVCLAVFLTLALWIIVIFISEGFFRGLEDKNRFFKKIADINGKISTKAILFVQCHLFGSDDFDDEIQSEEWEGRLAYMEKAFREIVQKSENNVLLALEGTENNIKKNEALLLEALKSDSAEV